MSTTELAELIDSKFRELREGSIVTGTIQEIRPQVVLVDIGYKSEGAISISEFEDEEIEVGDQIEVLLERLENDEGIVVLSKEKAAHKQNWDKIVGVYRDGGLVKGKVKSVVKGGLMVNVGVEAFLPGSQVDIIPPRDLNEYVGKVYEFKIVKVNDDRKNIVLSRREVIEAERADQRQRFLETVKEGDKVEGLVKNITDFGAFVDLRGMDGLLHITDMSWTRKINHPSEVLKKGDEVEAIVLEIKKEDQRVSLGIKQLESDPWESINDRFKVGDMVSGQVAKIASFGAFVNLDGDIDGLIHISQLSEDHVERVKDVIKVGDEITARVIKVDSIERRIGLSIKAVNYDTEQLRRETASFEALRPSSDMVGLEHAFNLATRENEEWSPSEEK